MSYHESFWVALATAAPIIALANQFTLTESLRIRADLLWLQRSSRKLSDRSRRNLRIIRRFAVFVVALGIVNMIAQVLALAVALSSLADRQDDFPITLSVGIVGYGLGLVAATAGVLGLLQSVRGELEDWAAKHPASSDDRAVQARSRMVKSVSVTGGLGRRRR